MKIKIEGKTYEQLKFKGRALTRTLEIQDHLEIQESNGVFKLADLEMITEFLVTVFDEQFTTDDLLDGLELYEIITYFRQVSQEIMKKTNDKLGVLAKK